MTFNILFMGMVCHHSDPNGESAVFVSATDHELRLVVKKDDVVGTTTFGRDSTGLHTGNDLRKASYFVAGEEVLSLEGIVSSARVDTPDFTNTIPALRRGVSPPDVIPEVTFRQTKAGFITAHLLHDSGTFSVDEFFSRQGHFPSEPDGCIGQTVRLTLGTDASIVTINGQRNGARMTLVSDATVWFINERPVPTLSGNFNEYGKLLNGNPSLDALSNGGTLCIRPHPPDNGGLGTDCANSHNP